MVKELVLHCRSRRNDKDNPCRILRLHYIKKKKKVGLNNSAVVAKSKGHQHYVEKKFLILSRS